MIHVEMGHQDETGKSVMDRIDGIGRWLIDQAPHGNVKDLFAGFSSVRMTRFLTPYDTQGFGPIARLTGSRFGFFVGIVAKP